MKLLIATTGSTLRAPIARRFEKAAWYLLVDSDDGSVKKHRNTRPDRHHNIISDAADFGATCLVVERVGDVSLQRLSTHAMEVVRVRGCPADLAIERILRGEINPVAAEEILMRNQMLNRFRQVQRVAARRTGAVHGLTTGTRVQHHLQQYAGRGH